MKKSLLFGLLAVLAAVFIFTACDNGTTSSSTTTDYVDVPIEVDIVVTSVTGTNGLLSLFPAPAGTAPADSTTWKGKTIGLSIPLGHTLTAPLTIPAGYKVYLVGNTTLNTGAAAPAPALGLTVNGELEVGTRAVLGVAKNMAPIVVGNEGSITVDDYGELNIYKITSIIDSAAKPETVVGNTDKVKVAGGTLKLDVFRDTTLNDMNVAFKSIESGKLLIGGIQPFKPSQITESFSPTAERKIEIAVSKPEDTTTTTLTVPEGLILTATGSLPNVTQLNVYGEFTARSTLGALIDLTINGKFNATNATFTGLKTLTIEAGGESALLTSSFPTLDAVVVNGTLDLTGSTFGTTPVAIKVTVGDTGDLTLPAVTLKDVSSIGGKLTLTGNVTVGGTGATAAVLEIADPETVFGNGTAQLIAEGGTAGGTLTIKGLAGYTTLPGGVGGGAPVLAAAPATTLANAVEAIPDNFIDLMRNLPITTPLDVTTFGPHPAVPGIGSTTLLGQTATNVYYNNLGTPSGDTVSLSAGAGIVPSKSTAVEFAPGKDKSGKPKVGTGSDADDVAIGDFDVSVSTTGVVQITDGDYDATNPKNVVITFKNYLPAHSGLIAPEDYLVSFSIGIITGRN